MVRRRRECHPATDLVLIETDLARSGLEPRLRDPTDRGHARKLGEVAGCPVAIEGQLTGGVDAADQQAVPTLVVQLRRPPTNCAIARCTVRYSICKLCFKKALYRDWSLVNVDFPDFSMGVP